MRFLTVVFASREEFLAHFSDKYTHGALFCPTKADATLHSQVIIDVSMPTLAKPARLRGQVISENSGRGVWVAFNRKSSATVTYLQDTQAKNAEDLLSRAHSRYPAHLSVRCRIDEDNPETETLQGKIVDLSQGGAFISGEQVPMVGTRVSLNIDIEAASSGKTALVYRVDGRVAWVGKVDDHDGFGVRFDRSGNFGAAPLRSLLRRGSEAGRLDLA